MFSICQVGRRFCSSSFSNLSFKTFYKTGQRDLFSVFSRKRISENLFRTSSFSQRFFSSDPFTFQSKRLVVGPFKNHVPQVRWEHSQSHSETKSERENSQTSNEGKEKKERLEKMLELLLSFGTGNTTGIIGTLLVIYLIIGSNPPDDKWAEWLGWTNDALWKELKLGLEDLNSTKNIRDAVTKLKILLDDNKFKEAISAVSFSISLSLFFSSINSFS